MTDNIPPLKSLQAFEASARHESFLTAADELCVTPGAVSRHVKLLEHYLGVRLFLRRSNGVALTHEGQRYASRIVAIFDMIAETTGEIRRAGNPNSMVISTLPVFSESWLNKRLPSFQAKFPGIDLQVEFHDNKTVLQDAGIDAWIHFSDGHHPGFDVTHLMDEELVPVCSPGLRQSLSDEPTAAQLAEMPLLHDVNWGDDWPNWAMAVGAKSDNLSTGMRFALYSGVIQSAIDGLGIAIGHKSMVRNELDSGRLVEFPALSYLPPQSFYLAIPATRFRMSHLKKLKEWFITEARKG